jgi:beta-N-acetylhexosaminidase
MAMRGRPPARDSSGPRFLLAVLVAAALVVALAAVGSGRDTVTASFVPPGGLPPSAVPPAPASARPSPTTAPLALDACATAAVAKLGLDAQVGQLLMVGTKVTSPADLADTVRLYHLGGTFLAGRSSASAASIRQGVQALQAAATSSGGIPLQVAVDQEGGEVQTLKGTDFPPVPTAVEQGRLDAATLRARTAGWAVRLLPAGITLDLAPVADTVPPSFAGSNPPIGGFDRQYGSTPDAVARDISTVVTAIQSTGVLTTVKHFPGLGRVHGNTDTASSVVDPVTTVDDPFLEPFVAGIRAGTAAVMVSLAQYPQLDPDSIAAFSRPIVTGLLRDRLGFTGLIVSDDLGAAASAGPVPVGDRAVRFVEAGGDMVLTVRSTDAAPMSAALMAQAQASPDFRAQVSAAATRVLRSKFQAGLLTCAR